MTDIITTDNQTKPELYGGHIHSAMTAAPEKPKRISGTGYDPKTPGGQLAIKYLKYKRELPDGTYEIDTDAIRTLVEDYTDEERRTIEKTINIVNKKNGTVTSYQEERILPISRVGLRRLLGISPETYSIWLHGYVNRSDIDNEDVEANIELSEALRAGDDAIIQYLVEDNNKDVQHKQVELLRTYGEIATKDSQTINVGVKLDLGGLSKYGC
jgi:hypothetical protein